GFLSARQLGGVQPPGQHHQHQPEPALHGRLRQRRQPVVVPRLPRGRRGLAAVDTPHGLGAGSGGGREAGGGGRPGEDPRGSSRAPHREGFAGPVACHRVRLPVPWGPDVHDPRGDELLGRAVLLRRYPDDRGLRGSERSQAGDEAVRLFLHPHRRGHGGGLSVEARGAPSGRAGRPP
ncbi:unnamed protein product, partial [Ectocarpus fasciculatus]